ncbi:hypothetical protein Hdeb2414_s0007g00257751 [Helianthus debilis subsp. tardiflorus]
MARTMGRGSVPVGGRGFGQDDGQAGGRGVGRGSSQGSGVAGNQGTWRCGGRVYMRGGGQTNNRVVGRRSGIGNSQSSSQVGDQGVGRGGVQYGDRGVGRGGVQYGDRGVGDADDESDFHVMNSPTESSAGDDDSAIHVAPTRWGSASHVQVPEPINREWIWVVDGECISSGRINGMHEFIGAGRSALLVNSLICCGMYEMMLKLQRKKKVKMLERI